MNSAALALHQLRYEQKMYWRNPASAFFTFAFPLVFLVIFASLNNGQTIDFLGGLAYNQYYIPGILTFGLISACYTNLAITLCLRRETGSLKRLRSTPLPASSLISGVVLNSVVVSAILVALVTAMGMLFYDVTFPGHWAAFLVALVVGVVTFCLIGVAVASLIGNADAAPAVVNGVLFPIVFMSGLFYPLRDDSVLAKIADVFPIRHLLKAVFATFDPRLPHGISHGFAWQEVGWVALWGVVAAVVAVRAFRWEPKRS